VFRGATLALGASRKRGEKVTVTGGLSMPGADRTIAPGDSHPTAYILETSGTCCLGSISALVKPIIATVQVTADT
jgi:hypothetical protein